MKKDLEKLVLKDEALGRPPICIFQYGDHITETVLIESIDPTFTDPRWDISSNRTQHLASQVRPVYDATNRSYTTAKESYYPSSF